MARDYLARQLNPLQIGAEFTRYHVVEGGLWSIFDFDDLIQRLAGRTNEINEDGLPPAIHAPQSPILNCETRSTLRSADVTRLAQFTAKIGFVSKSSKASLIKAPWFAPGAFFFCVSAVADAKKQQPKRFHHPIAPSLHGLLNPY